MSGNGEKITISDIAEALGISKTTVSRAISGKGRIGEDTVRRVQATKSVQSTMLSTTISGMH